MHLSQQITGLLDDTYDLGFARADEVGDGIIAEPAQSSRGPKRPLGRPVSAEPAPHDRRRGTIQILGATRNEADDSSS